MAEVRDLARPIVSATACLHANQTGRQFFEEAQHFAATQFPIEQGRACNIGTVNLENVFGQIEPDGANILHGTVPPLWRSSNDHALALDAVGAGRSTSSYPWGQSRWGGLTSPCRCLTPRLSRLERSALRGFFYPRLAAAALFGCLGGAPVAAGEPASFL